MPNLSLRRSNSDEPSQTHRRILRAALGVFAEFGYSGASTREIARRAGVHQPALAYHFKGKEQLWKAAVQAVFSDFETALRNGMAEFAKYDDRLHNLASIYVRFVANNPEWVTFVIHEGQQTGERSRWLAEVWLRPQARLLYGAMTGQPWPDGDAAAEARAFSMLAVLTGSTAVFAQRAQIEQAGGVDIHSPAFVDQHVETMRQVLKVLISIR